MLVGRVIQNLIYHHFQPKPVRRSNQRIEVGERAETGVDVGVIGDVIAHVQHR